MRLQQLSRDETVPTAVSAGYAHEMGVCLKTLVSELHEKHALHQLAHLPFDAELQRQLHKVLGDVANNAPVAQVFSDGRPRVSALEVSYALWVQAARKKQDEPPAAEAPRAQAGVNEYKEAALVMHRLAVQLETEVACQFLKRPSPELCLLYTSPSPRDQRGSRMPSSA